MLHMTQANVRRHLDILEEQNLVEVIGHRPSEGKGRPPRFFGASEKSLGNNLDLLTSILLQEVNKMPSPEFKETLIENVAKSLLLQMSSYIEQHQGELNIPKDKYMSASGKSESTMTSKGISRNLSQRLYRAIHDLNRFHYSARWEAHVESPRVILGHCPYRRVPYEHPELCQIDSLLLAGLLEAEVDQIARLAKDKRGATSCIFRVQNNY